MPRNPCLPSPCGPNAICQTIGENPACTCMNGYMGVPPNCRPECTINADCTLNMACMREKCRDPCPGSCGIRARCSVVNHTPICVCPDGFTGDALTNCVPNLIAPRKSIFQTKKTRNYFFNFKRVQLKIYNFDFFL